MPADPGRANERTALGWQRAALSLAAIAALLLVHAVHEHEPLAIVAAFVVGAGAIWVGAAGRRLYRRRERADAGAVAPRSLLAMLVVTLVAAVLAAATVVGGP